MTFSAPTEQWQVLPTTLPPCQPVNSQVHGIASSCHTSIFALIRPFRLFGECPVVMVMNTDENLSS